MCEWACLDLNDESQALVERFQFHSQRRPTPRDRWMDLFVYYLSNARSTQGQCHEGLKME